MTTSYYLGRGGFSQIRVAGETPYVLDVGMAVRKDWTPFTAILQKALDAIPAADRDAIYHQWIAIKYRHSFDYTLLWQVLAVATLLLLAVGYRNRRLLREVRQRRRAETALREAHVAAQRANRAKSEFLAKMSHDLRTPLNSVLGFSELLLEDEPDSDRRDYAKAIHGAGEALHQLLNDILDLSRIEADRVTLRPEAMNVPALIDELRSLFALASTTKGLGLGLDLHIGANPGMPECLILDRVRVRQILTNLIGNAVKFTDRGQVAVRLSARPSSANRLHFEVAVSDTGIGIPADQQDRIFGIFNQAREDDRSGENGTGLGLGLAIAQRLARLMGGEVRLHSTPGQGSTFRLILPRVSTCPPTVDRAPGAPSRTPEFAPAQVLVVDDAPLNRRLLVRHLAGTGLRLREAGDGQEALKEAGSHPPDLILMDISLPVLDGLEATRRLKCDPATADIPVIAVTATVTPDRRQAIEAVCDGFLGKPVSRARLFAAVGAFLEAKPKPSSPPNHASPSAAPVEPSTPLELPPSIGVRLDRLDPGTAPVNEYEALAEALILVGRDGGDPRIGAAGHHLAARVRDFDLKGMAASVATLRLAVPHRGT